MKNIGYIFLFLFGSLLSACAAPPAQEAPLEAEVPLEAYAIFSINVQDFSYPDLSAAALDRIITLHEQYDLPVDIYLTDTMAAIYAADYPQLLERLRTSPVVSISYHYRAPRPYANQYDWLGLAKMTPTEQYKTILRYETHAVDPVTGETTDAAGGYQNVASLIGYPPIAASSSSKDASVDNAVMQVYRELGAQMTVTHGKALNLGDTKGGLPVRPEHKDYKLFEHVGEEPAQAFENALAEAQAASGETLPFIGIKVHDNDLFATRSAWLTVYVDGGKRPDWDPTRKAPLLSDAEENEIWTFYEATLQYIASQNGGVRAVNLPIILDMLEKGVTQ